MAVAGPKRTARTNRRLAKLRLTDPSALPGIKADGRYTNREARKVFRASHKPRAAKPPTSRPYNPLAPLTGDRLAQETQAAESLQFGPQEQELRRAQANQRQTALNTGSYYDDFRAALANATERIKATNAANIAASEGRVDSAFAQDRASVQQRDAEATRKAQLLGRGPVSSTEGARAVEAQRSQGNLAVSRQREGASADNTYLESRGANAALGKAQAMEREAARARRLGEQGQQLATDRGSFRVDFQRKQRDSERNWAAIQKEFGLKTEEFQHEKAQDAVANKVKAQANNTQKIVARIYAAADKSKARAQVRVAELQLEKGKISQTQYRHIINTYKGLNNDKPKSKGGTGSGPGGKLATWETDKVDVAVRSLTGKRVPLNEKNKWIKYATGQGLPLRLARIAWSRYAKTFVVKNDRSGA